MERLEKPKCARMNTKQSPGPKITRSIAMRIYSHGLTAFLACNYVYKRRATKRSWKALSLNRFPSSLLNMY